jgi:hypothetical protein
LEEKEKEIALLQKKLSELQQKIDPKIPTIPEPVLIPIVQDLGQQFNHVQVSPPVVLEPLVSPMKSLEDKLTIIQVISHLFKNEINTLTAKITMVASQTPKEIIREIIREPAIIPAQPRDPSYLAHAISISGDDTSLSSGQLRSIEEIPNIASLLKKILKSRKVHYPEPALKSREPAVLPKPSGSFTREENLRSSTISKHIARLEAELNEKKRLLSKEGTLTNNNKRDQRTDTRNAATSPPNESYLFSTQKTTEKRSKSPDYLYHTKPEPFQEKYSYRAATDHSKHRKTKPRSKPEYSTCECSTCSENVSWICPGCVSEESSIRQPRYKLFEDDTSMIRPLAEIVSDLENERMCKINLGTMMPSFAVVDRFSHADGELLEVISSLNGL